MPDAIALGAGVFTLDTMLTMHSYHSDLYSTTVRYILIGTSVPIEEAVRGR